MYSNESTVGVFFINVGFAVLRIIATVSSSMYLNATGVCSFGQLVQWMKERKKKQSKHLVRTNNNEKHSIRVYLSLSRA